MIEKPKLQALETLFPQSCDNLRPLPLTDFFELEKVVRGMSFIFRCGQQVPYIKQAQCLWVWVDRHSQSLARFLVHLTLKGNRKTLWGR